jgi:hypothetical protein
VKVFCGIDWAEDHHDIALIDDLGRLIHRPTAPTRRAFDLVVLGGCLVRRWLERRCAQTLRQAEMGCVRAER